VRDLDIDIYRRHKEIYDSGDYDTNELLDSFRSEQAEVNHARRVEEEKASGSVVYYIRFCCRVKIGYTSNIKNRLKDVPCHELLAVEPGGRAVEGDRHQQFARLHDVGEWFHYGPELQAHVRTLRGEPPILVDTETAAHHAGREITVIYRWANEGRLTRYGGRGRNGARWDLRQIPAWSRDSGRPMPAPPPKIHKGDSKLSG
jgi:hypothetical protein